MEYYIVHINASNFGYMCVWILQKSQCKPKFERKKKLQFLTF